MQKKVNINDKSIETAGVKKDFKSAITEYIWNSFDAKATEVIIKTSTGELSGLDYIDVIDNGEGISFENLDNTFGSFLYSEKTNIAINSNIHGNKGKGRYSFVSFATTATWETIYKFNNKQYLYKITINSNNKDFYDVTEKEKTDAPTGTKVRFYNITGLSSDSLNSFEFREGLLNNFAWFLYLNKDKNYRIIVDGKQLHYDKFIDEKLSESLELNIEGSYFKIHFIKWIDEIKQKYYYYFMNDEKIEVYKKHTSFNNNAIDFFHSVYVVSDYFNDFTPLHSEDDNQFTICTVKCEKDKVFKQLLKELNQLIERKRKAFVKEEVPKIIKKFDEDGIFPKFADNKYEQERKKDLVNVVTEIYCVQPKIFHKLNSEQKKSIVGFLNLLLSTEERENIIIIIDNIVKLSSEERNDLSNVLKKTSLTQIIQTMKMIENRYKVIELLKKLVFDFSNFTTERYHIQKAIQENYWLFGEQYQLVSADENFEKALKEYLYIIDNTKEKELYKIDNQDRLRRPDIFMCKKRKVQYFNDTQLEENIIIELKEPKVPLSKDVYRQIEDYMDLISKEPKFNSQLRKWKFIAVCCEVDDFIKDLYKTCLDKGKLFLVRPGEKFEIYAMTWDDVFKSFEIRHSYIYEKLEYDRSAIEEELKIKGIMFSRQGSDEIRDKLLDLKAN